MRQPRARNRLKNFVMRSSLLVALCCGELNCGTTPSVTDAFEADLTTQVPGSMMTMPLEGMPETVKRSDTKPALSEIRGELPGMAHADRFLSENRPPQLSGFQAEFDRATGRANYGFGDLPSSDPFDRVTQPWLSATGEARERLRQEVQSRLFDAVTSQTEGVDMRTVPIGWNDVTVTEKRKGDLRVFGSTTNERFSYVEYTFHFPSGLLGMLVTGRILIPNPVIDGGRPVPAVIYQHFHGGAQDVGTKEINDNWALQNVGTPAQVLMKLGYIVIAVDVHGFHRRRVTEDRTDSEVADIQDELADTKDLAAHGMSRFSVRTFEDYLVFRLTRQHPLVDPKRIGSMGMSMGSSRTFVLAALAGQDLGAAVASAHFPIYFDTIKAGKIAAHRNTHTLLDQLARYDIDTEHWLFSAGATNLRLQFGKQDVSSPGWERLFALAKQVPSAGKAIEEDVDPNARHDWIDIIKAYDFMTTTFENRSVEQQLRTLSGG
jgi:dienelactone hydrolase